MVSETKPGAQTRRRVLDVAARMFRDKGYAAVTLRGVAAEVGVQPASLYYHFANKDDLVVEVLDQGIRVVLEAVREALDALPPGTSQADRLRAAVLAHLRGLLEHSAYTSANVRIFGQLPAEVQARNAPLRKAYEALWDDLLAQALRAGALRPDADLKLFRLLVIGALNATVEWFRPEVGALDALADATADLLLRGIVKEGAA